MSDEFKIAINKDDLAYMRKEENPIWKSNRQLLSGYFGPLVKLVKGKILYDPYLTDCYVRDFMNHSCEKGLIGYIENMLGDDIKYYSPLKELVDKNIHYVHNLLGSADEFDPTSWKDTENPRILCGPKASGKTTLLLFTNSAFQVSLRNIK